VLANAALVFTDPDVPEAVLALVGSELPPASGPEPAEVPKAADDVADGDDAAPVAIPGGPDVRPALGDPTEVAKTLANEARTGVDVVREIHARASGRDPSVRGDVRHLRDHEPRAADRCHRFCTGQRIDPPPANVGIPAKSSPASSTVYEVCSGTRRDWPKFCDPRGRL